MVANGTESNGLKRIFVNKENCGKSFGAPLYQVVLMFSIKPISSSISLSYNQKFETSGWLVPKWPTKNKGTRDASVSRSIKRPK